MPVFLRSFVALAQNIINCAWSSIQGLIRTVPAAFSTLPSALHQPVKTLIREIVDTGFRSGLLRKGMMHYHWGEPLGDAQQVADDAWSSVRPPLFILFLPITSESSCNWV